MKYQTYFQINEYMLMVILLLLYHIKCKNNYFVNKLIDIVIVSVNTFYDFKYQLLYI